jgi:biopolymer transport protein ExbB/TolQ
MAFDVAGNNLTAVVAEVGSVLLWMQALGIILMLWIVFEIVTLYFNQKRMHEVYKIKEDMARIEGKIDRILKAKR